jgi:hypothetical protein
MVTDHDDTTSERERLRQAMLDERRKIERLLAQAADSGEPLSLFEKGRIDDHIATIKQLAARYQSLSAD